MTCGKNRCSQMQADAGAHSLPKPCRSGQQQWVVTMANEDEFTYYINAYAGRPCGSSYLAAGGTCSSKSTKCQLTDPRTAATAVLQVCDGVRWLNHVPAGMGMACLHPDDER